MPDGTLCDGFNLHRGYWEAKDTDDHLDAELAKKIKKGYSLTKSLSRKLRRFFHGFPWVAEFGSPCRCVRLQTLEHQMDHRHLNHGLARSRRPLVILAVAAILPRPAIGPFDDPAVRQMHQPVDSRRPLHHRDHIVDLRSSK